MMIDRGTTRWDEINPTPVPSLGWPWREGIDQVMVGAPAGLFGPELVMARSTGFRQVEGLTGLTFYKGANASLSAMLLFADKSGKIFAVPRTALDNGAPNRVALIENRTLDFRPQSGTIDGIVAMLVVGADVLLLDRHGDLFLMS